MVRAIGFLSYSQALIRGDVEPFLALYSDADDITAEAWARACEAWPRIINPRPWVYRVVTNLAYKAYRESQMTCLSADPCTDYAVNALWVSGAGRHE